MKVELNNYFKKSWRHIYVSKEFPKVCIYSNIIWRCENKIINMDIYFLSWKILSVTKPKTMFSSVKNSICSYFLKPSNALKDVE
jgi:hypothetical protein